MSRLTPGRLPGEFDRSFLMEKGIFNFIIDLSLG
jgi:hypothetical protein